MPTTDTCCETCGTALEYALSDWLYCRWCDSMLPPGGMEDPVRRGSLPDALVDAYLFVCAHTGNGADPRRFEDRGIRMDTDDDNDPGRNWMDAEAVRAGLEALFAQEEEPVTVRRLDLDDPMIDALNHATPAMGRNVEWQRDVSVIVEGWGGGGRAGHRVLWHDEIHDEIAYWYGSLEDCNRIATAYPEPPEFASAWAPRSQS